MGCVYDLNAIKEKNQRDKIIEAAYIFRTQVLPDFQNGGYDNNIVYNGVIISAIDSTISTKKMTKKEFLKSISYYSDYFYGMQKDQGD